MVARFGAVPRRSDASAALLLSERAAFGCAAIIVHARVGVPEFFGKPLPLFPIWEWGGVCPYFFSRVRA